MLAVIAGYGRKLVQNPTPLTAVSLAYRPATAATNSSRAVMLIRLIISPADENRSGANQMRQHRSFREHFRRGNAPIAEDVVLLKDDIAEIDPDAELDPPLLGHLGLAVTHPTLDLHSAANGIH